LEVFPIVPSHFSSFKTATTHVIHGPFTDIAGVFASWRLINKDKFRKNE
jgi:hypothetical protein